MFELVFLIIFWIIVRNIGRIIKHGVPGIRRAATTLRQQLEKQMQGHGGTPAAPQKQAESSGQLDQQMSMTIDGEKPAWEYWTSLDEDAKKQPQESFTTREGERAPLQKSSVQRRYSTAAATAEKQKPLLPQLGGDALVQAVVLSEVLGPPKSRRKANGPPGLSKR